MARELSSLDDRLLTDAELVVLAKSDPAQFAALYERYRDPVYWYLLTRTKRAADAEDLLQTSFLKALAALEGYRPEKAPFAGWLFAIVRNTASSFHSRRATTVAWDLVPEIMLPVDEHDYDARLVRQEDLGELRDLFGTLDETSRELLILRFVAGLRIGEIATVLGKSEAATQKQLWRVLQKLKEGYHDHAV